MIGMKVKGKNSMIERFDELTGMAQAMHEKTKIACVAAHDLHTLEALTAARKSGIAEAILIGNSDEIQSMLTELDEDPKDYEILQCTDIDEAISMAATFVKEGKAGAIMKGKLTTGEIMRGILRKENGLRTGRNLSVTGLFEIPGFDRILAVTDVAITPHPDLEGKKGILMNALDILHALGMEEPKVAVIAAAETVNPKVPETVDAAILKECNQKGEITGCIIEGPISLDLALDEGSAMVKGYESPVAGKADLFMMPDLVSANVLAKSITGIAKGRTAGIVLGAKVPIILVSRSASAEEKYTAIALAAVTAPYFANKYREE